jgi:chaperonin GroES
MPNIRPLKDRVILRQLEAEATSKGGIIIPENAKEKPLRGQVVAVGSGKQLTDGSFAKSDYVVGDTVLFAKYQVTEIVIDDESLLVVRGDDILGVIETM